jgi:hypothetical protein
VHNQFNHSEIKSQGNSLLNVSYLKTGKHIQIYNNSISFINTKYHRLSGNPSPVKRSSIKEFSHASRCRLIRIFSKIRLSQLSSPLFVTLTYHYGYKDDPSSCKRHLNTFLQYLRDNYPSVAYLWRLELQQRGAPHFHFFFWGMPGDDMVLNPSFSYDLKLAWHRIADPHSSAHNQFGFNAKTISSYRGCFHYVSKYCAKESDMDRSPCFGRRWGYSSNLPLDPLVNIEIPTDVYYLIKRICRKIYKHRGPKNRRFIKVLGSRCSTTLFISHSLSLKILDYSLDTYCSAIKDIVSRHMFISHIIEDG